MTQGSVMPAYPHLLTRKLNFGTIQQRVKVAAALGAPYERELTEAEDMARKQAREIVKELVKQGGPSTVTKSSGEEVALEETHVIALIAYMQRVGIDLYATDSTTENKTDEKSEQDKKDGKSDQGKTDQGKSDQGKTDGKNKDQNKKADSDKKG